MDESVVFNDIKAKVPIEEAIPLLNLVMKRHTITSGTSQGRLQWRGDCPKCKSTDGKSLAITEGKGYFCQRAKKGGSILDLVMHVRGCSVRDAGLFIQQFKGTVPQEQGLKEAVRSFQGSVNFEQIAARLDPAHDECQKLGLSEATLKHFTGGYDKAGVTRGHVICGLHDAQAQLVGFLGLNKPWFPNNVTLTDYVFNWHRVEQGEVYLMPTPLEVIQAFENGIENCIAFLTPDISPAQLTTLATLLREKQCQIVL